MTRRKDYGRMRIMDEQELKKKFKERVLKHNELVNYFAKQVGEIYTGHDIDKLYDWNLLLEKQNYKQILYRTINRHQQKTHST